MLLSSHYSLKIALMTLFIVSFVWQYIMKISVDSELIAIFRLPCSAFTIIHYFMKQSNYEALSNYYAKPLKMIICSIKMLDFVSITSNPGFNATF